MIIDIHAHVWPYLGGASGWDSVSAHLAALQKSVYIPPQPQVEGKKMPDSAEINFRVSKFGRFEWTEGGVNYYRQYMPSWLSDQTASPEFMLAQMDKAGVDMVLLQNAKVYGKLNDYFAECIAKYPDRFVAVGEINELEADKNSEISKLRHIIKELGLKGIYFDVNRFYQAGISDNFDDSKFDVFWREINDLGASIFWRLIPARCSAEDHLQRLKLLAKWLERFPDITSVLTHGLYPIKPFLKNGEFEIPKEFLDVFRYPNVYAEILYPILIDAYGLGWDYPFPQVRKLIKHLYEEVGADRLAWGTDMPLVQNCTYQQCLTYLKDYCDFISPKDMGLILGGNALRILKIKTSGSAIPTTKRVDFTG